MGQLHNKKVLLGVTGGIAAYKSADLVRRLQDAGAEVRVVMSRAATEFITPMTMQALSGHPVHMDLLDAGAESAMGHIELARWADLVLVAPATANFLAKIANGRADDLLTTVCLASAAPLLLAPAMNQGMWHDPATVNNVEILRQRQITLVGPAAGEQACGDIGLGRMEEPPAIIERAQAIFETGLLDGRSVLLTAGPTREALDPVRFISNHSSGKMGFALAEAAAEAGASTTVIAGPIALQTPPGVTRVNVTSAEEMLEAVLAQLAGRDIFIATAAVADYRPAEQAGQKIKKSSESMVIPLVINPDILATVASRADKPFTVGFAAETSDLEHYARDKLKRKNLDMIVANSVTSADTGFNADDNEGTVYWPGGECELARSSKKNMARQLIALIAERYTI